QQEEFRGHPGERTREAEVRVGRARGTGAGDCAQRCSCGTSALAAYDRSRRKRAPGALSNACIHADAETRTMIGTLMRPLASAATVAAAMYFFDPDSGRRRRALLRDRLTSAARDFNESLGVAGRDLSHRLHGVSSRGRHLFTRDEV